MRELEEMYVPGGREGGEPGDAVTDREVITRRDIEESGAENVSEALEEHPSVDVRPGFRGGRIQIQGLDSEHTLILIDGERLIGRIGGELDLDRLSLDDVESIEVLQGAGSALYGSDALGGVIHIRTQDARCCGAFARVRLAYGIMDPRRGARFGSIAGGPSLGTNLPSDGYGGTYDLSATGGYGAERWGARVSLGVHRQDGFDLDPSDAATTGSQAEQIAASSRIDWRPKAGHRTRFSAQYVFNDLSAVDLRGARARFDRLSRTEELRVGASHEAWLAHGSRLNARLYYTSFEDQLLVQPQVDPPPTPASVTTQRLGQATLRWLWPIREDHLLTLGHDAFFETLDANRLQRPGGRGRFAPYASHEWIARESPRISVVSGLRADYDTWFGGAVSPKVAVRVDPVEALQLRVSAGRGFRSPDFRELLLNFTENASIGYVVVGNENLEPETSWSLQGAATWTVNDQLTLTARGYANWVDGLITFEALEENDGVTRFTYVNVEQARTAGGSAEVQFQPLDVLSIKLAYHYLDARDLSQDRVLEGRARHRGSLRVRVAPNEGRTALIARTLLVGPRPFYFTEDGVPLTIEAGSYLSLDLRGEQQLGHGLSAFVGVDNAFNAGGQFLGIRPRTYYAGVTYRVRPDTPSAAPPAPVPSVPSTPTRPTDHQP
ncbi:MAG: TonB-dependent receptor [Myxococcota bacterium]